MSSSPRLLLVVESNHEAQSFTLELDKVYRPKRGTKITGVSVVDIDAPDKLTIERDPDKHHINMKGVTLRGSDE